MTVLIMKETSLNDVFLLKIYTEGVKTYIYFNKNILFTDNLLLISFAANT